CRCASPKCRNRYSRSRGAPSAPPKGNKKKPAGAERHPQGGRAHRGHLFPRVFSPEFTNRARRAVAKLNLLLLAVLVACALGLVTSQHRARKLFSELEREHERSRELDVEYGRLQLEASTWGLHSRVERIAAASLGLRPPDPRRVRVVRRDAAR